ncbi:MAG: hypothetical protein R8K20_11795 [Gallionellaceae bacterium]
MSEERAVLHGEHVLPTGTVCDLQLIKPSLANKQPDKAADLRVEVGSVIFSGGNIRLNLKVKSLSSAARQIINAQKPRA